MKRIFRGNFTKKRVKKEKRISSIALMGWYLYALFLALSYYLYLPALNFKNLGFWGYLILIYLPVMTISLFSDEVMSMKKKTLIYYVPLGIIVVLFVLASISGSIMFNARHYASQIKDNMEVNFENYKGNIQNVPILDKESADLIILREAGKDKTLVSQFKVLNSEQITMLGNSYRISPMEHAGLSRAIHNRKVGTPGYVIIDMKTQNAKLQKVDGGMQYTQTAWGKRNLTRHLRYSFPTLIMDKSILELDEEEKPFYVTPIIKCKIGIFGGKDVVGIILTNPTTGENIKYDLKDIPKWVDNVYPTNLLLKQYNNYGKYKNGYVNTMPILGAKKDIFIATNGYNYIPIEDDNWIYTGITSITNDESNIGFILINKRTKLVETYYVSGAEEYSAMDGAMGVVQDLGYRATFPLLININNQPTYLVSLKDSSGLVKKYSLINVEKFRIIAVEDTIDKCMQKYLKLMKADLNLELNTDVSTSIDMIVPIFPESITIINNIIYIKIKDNNYRIDIFDNENVTLTEIEL